MLSHKTESTTETNPTTTQAPVQKLSIEQMLADTDEMLKAFAEDYRRMAE